MGNFPKPYKIGIVGLLAIMAITIVPFNGETSSNDGKFYGLLTLVNYDENGNEVFAQSIHNRLVDTGETFLLEGGFRDGPASPADNLQIGAICIAQGTIGAAGETETATSFDTANSQTTGTNCIVDADVDLSVQGTAVIGPETFTGGTHITATETVNGIGICQSNAGSTPFTDCINGDGAASGILFSFIDTADVTLASLETVQITYTFDITSPSD